MYIKVLTITNINDHYNNTIRELKLDNQLSNAKAIQDKLNCFNRLVEKSPYKERLTYKVWDYNLNEFCIMTREHLEHYGVV